MTDQITPISTNLADRVRQIAEHGNVCPSERHWLEQAAAALSTRTVGPVADQGLCLGCNRMAEIAVGYCLACHADAHRKLWGKRAGPDREAVADVPAYDAGLLNDYGGGNVEWWQDYIRAELERAHEHYLSHMPTPPAGEAIDRAREALERIDGHVSHALMGDWTIAVREIRKISREARQALSALPPAPVDGVERSIDFEVWEDDLMVAASSDEADARHYFSVYSQDGPVRLVRAETVRTTIIPAPAQPGDHP